MRYFAATFGLVGVVLAGLAASWLAGSIMVKGRHSRVLAATAPTQDVRFQARDEATIAATFRPGKTDHSQGVLILHGVGASRQASAANAEWLATLGYATLAIDFRGHGESSSEQRTFGLDEALDARAAFDWLKQRQGNAPVAIIGISLGGAASLIGDDGPIRANALVLQAVYPDIRHAIRNRIASRTFGVIGDLLEPLLSFQAPLRFGVWPSRLSPLTALPQYVGPVLIIGGEQDRATPPDETRAMFDVVRGDRTLWMVPTGDHAEICDLADAVYRGHVGSFLARAIGVPG